MRFGWQRGELEFDATGLLTGLLRDGTTYLVGAGEPEVWLDGLPVCWGEPTVTVDVDELVASHATDQVSAVVRHTVATQWSVRLAIANLTAEPLRLSRVGLGWVPAEDCPAWGLAAGAVASYAVLPPSGDGPVLGGRLRLGDCSRIDGRRITVGSLTLPPGGRYVTQWGFAWHPTPAAFERGRHRAVPRRQVATVGTAIPLDVSEDEAVLVPGGLEAEREGAQLVLSAGHPGRFPVEIRAARGTVRYDLCWVGPVQEVADAAAAVALARAGRRPLDVDAALLVQQLVRGGRAEEPRVAEDALDLAVAQAVERDDPDPRAVSLLCGEYERYGDLRLLDLARRWVLGTREPRAGLGLAATRFCLAEVARGGEVEPVLTHLSALGAAGSGRTVETRAAALELRLVTGPPPGTTGGGTGRELAELQRLGGWLGAGLSGTAIRDLPVETAAHLAAVLALSGEEAGRRLRPLWGCDAEQLSRWTAETVLSRIGDPPVGAALSWLSMVRVMV